MKLLLQSRDVLGKKVSRLRKQGLTPGVIYGSHLSATIPVTFTKNDFLKAYKSLGSSSPVVLELDGDEHMALMYDYTVDPVTDELLHADFLAIQAGKKVSTSVSLIFVGVSPAEKNKIGTVQHLREDIEIEALPKDLPKSIEVDISSLATESDVIYLSDLVLPKGVVALEQETTPVATVSALSSGVDEEEEVGDDA